MGVYLVIMLATIMLQYMNLVNDYVECTRFSTLQLLYKLRLLSRYIVYLYNFKAAFCSLLYLDIIQVSIPTYTCIIMHVRICYAQVLVVPVHDNNECDCLT